MASGDRLIDPAIRSADPIRRSDPPIRRSADPPIGRCDKR
jgi:hypothetical protein